MGISTHRAYETLSDDSKRKMYDLGFNPEMQESPSDNDNYNSNEFSESQEFQDFQEFAKDFSFGAGFDPFQELFASMGFRQHRAKQRAGDVQRKQNTTVGTPQEHVRS